MKFLIFNINSETIRCLRVFSDFLFFFCPKATKRVQFFSVLLVLVRHLRRKKKKEEKLMSSAKSTECQCRNQQSVRREGKEEIGVRRP